MASRPEIKVKKSEPDDAAQEAPSQKVKKEAGNYRLQVDRQTKASYTALAAAEAAGEVIKAAHPIVQVSIYDSVDCFNKLIGAEPAPEKAKAEKAKVDETEE